MHKILRVEVLDGYRLHLTFDDGKCGIVDLSQFVGKGVFSIWTDPAVFAGVRIGDFGELVWRDEIDLCPDALYCEATGQRPEDVFSNLNHEHAYA